MALALEITGHSYLAVDVLGYFRRAWVAIMLIQLVLVVGGIVGAIVCILTGHTEAAGIFGGACGFLFFMSMMP